MTEFLLKFLDTDQDGILSAKEGMIPAAVVLAVLLVLVVVVFRLVERSHIRKTSIFRVKKNKYKSRLGKKNIKY